MKPVKTGGAAGPPTFTIALLALIGSRGSLRFSV